jgi:DNA-binding response OmpR family regulator
VVSRDRLRRAGPRVVDPADVDGHIWTLREKLGRDNRKRIQTVKGVGYSYVSPARPAEKSLSLLPSAPG